MRPEVGEILKRIPGVSPGDEAEVGPIAPGEGLGVAADELLAAIEAGDKHGVVSALRSAFQMLSAEEESAEGEMDED